jgi:polyphenol oxidase
MVIPLIVPDWPAPANVVAYTTTRQGGVSQGSYHSLNLSYAVGDNPQAVEENRRRLQQQTELPSEWIGLEQVHGTRCVVLDGQPLIDCRADAAYSRTPGALCSVLTADCLPLLLCSKRGDEVAAVHAGWRGLAAGIIEATLEHFQSAPTQWLVWLGPAIGPQALVVNEEVRAAFLTNHPEAAAAFVDQAVGDYWVDLYQLAQQRLQAVGIPAQQITGGHCCTFSEGERFFSYRREGITGRMASVIYFK